MISRPSRQWCGTSLELCRNEREAVHVLMTLEQPRKPMENEEILAGFCRSPARQSDCQRIQIRAFDEL